MKLKQVVGKIRFCNGFFSRSIGLMFSKKEDKALVFEFPYERKVSLHMFFVFYPIDVVFLDGERKVVEVKENFKPFAVYNPKRNAKYVIEMPAGSVKKFNVKINDKVEF